jgi:accessory gene regulator protein AgrB
MYVWIWSKLPGGRVGKIAGSVLLIAIVVSLLLFVIFPWLEPRLPLNNVTVNQ